jgi:hypothetical protein
MSKCDRRDDPDSVQTEETSKVTRQTLRHRTAVALTNDTPLLQCSIVLNW